MPHLFPPNRRRLYYVYLAQFLIPACYLVWLSHPWQIALGVFLLLVFAVIYVLSAWASYRGLIACIIGELALMLISGYVLNPGFFGTLFWPAAAIAGLRSWHRPAMLCLMIASALVELPELANVHHTSLWPYLPMIIAGIFSTILTTASVSWGISSMRSKEALRQAELTIERLTKTAERERISQDLHDVMGHELAMIALKAQVARKFIDRDHVRVATELNDISQSAKQALSRVRAYIADVVRPQLSEEWEAAANLLRTANIKLTADALPAVPACSPEATYALAMCLRESVTNVVKHSGAAQVRLTYDENETYVWLSIADSGRGFGVSQTPEERAGTTHGLSGIHARLAAVGGQLAVCSNGEWLTPNEGARVQVSDMWCGAVVQLLVPRQAEIVLGVDTGVPVEGFS